jgi:hypothetical protein
VRLHIDSENRVTPDNYESNFKKIKEVHTNEIICMDEEGDREREVAQ